MHKMCTFLFKLSYHTYYFLLYLTDHTIIEQYITSMPIIDKDAMVCGNCGKADDLMECKRCTSAVCKNINDMCFCRCLCMYPLFTPHTDTELSLSLSLYK